MVDAWALWSPGRAFDQICDPQSQVFRFCEVWAPARHRILGYVGGNHERRAIPGFGDLGVLLAALLRVPYSNGRQLIDLYYGKHQPFQISQWHGKGGARTKGGIANNLERFAAIGDSQLYLMGHHHQGLILPGWKEHRDRPRRRIKATKYIAALGTSFMDLWGSYGEVGGLRHVRRAHAVDPAGSRWALGGSAAMSDDSASLDGIAFVKDDLFIGEWCGRHDGTAAGSRRGSVSQVRCLQPSRMRCLVCGQPANVNGTVWTCPHCHASGTISARRFEA